VRKLLFLIVIAGTSYWAYQCDAAPGTPRLSLPRAAAWKHVATGSGQFVETAAVLEGRWRVEITGGRRPIVAVFDGTSFASNQPKAKADLLDPRPPLQHLYASLSALANASVEQLSGIACWHFSQRKGVSAVDAWVDTRTGFLRKVSGRAEGHETLDTYELLPIDVEHQAKKLFDTKSLQFLLPP
jgi:hypothetical protein